MGRQDPVFLGVDTSCYTTSLAVADRQGRLLADKRRLLPVAAGARGLRQSEGVFHHVRQLPQVMTELSEALDFPLKERLAGIAASVSPCRHKDSYMPVFRTGESLAKSLSAAFDVPFMATTHQEGHLMAALWSLEETLAPPFFAYHLSGGTTELLLVEALEKRPRFGFSYQIIARSLDLPAGQLVDRTGVTLGLPFPSGPHLEGLSKELGEALPKYSIPTFCREGNVSFSGAEAWVLRAKRAGLPPAQIARSVEHAIAGSLEKSLSQALERYPVRGAVLMGGVAANGYIRQRLDKRLKGRLPCYFAQPRYSSDNAVGVALLGAALELI